MDWGDGCYIESGLAWMLQRVQGVGTIADEATGEESG